MASLSPTPRQQFFDAAGIPLVGGKIYTYAGGTTTPITTYTTQASDVNNTNPIILDGRGQANIWLLPSVSYKYIVTDANDVTQYTVDNILVPIDNLSFSSPPPMGDIAPNTGAFTTLSATGNVTFTGAGATQLQVGSTSDRPTPVIGMIRYNSLLAAFEGYGSTGWAAIGGGAGATGGGTNQLVLQNDQTVTASYTISANKNAMSTGPLTWGAPFSGTGNIAGTMLTIDSVSVGALAVGAVIVGSTITAGTTITALGTGTGGIGTYTVSVSQSAGATTITAPIIITVPTGARWVII